jgi:hypothetical protein
MGFSQREINLRIQYKAINFLMCWATNRFLKGLCSTEFVCYSCLATYKKFDVGSFTTLYQELSLCRTDERCSCRWCKTISLNCAHQRAYCSPCRWYMSMESNGGMMMTGKREQLGGKPIRVPLCPPQIPHNRLACREPGAFRKRSRNVNHSTTTFGIVVQMYNNVISTRVIHIKFHVATPVNTFNSY